MLFIRDKIFIPGHQKACTSSNRCVADRGTDYVPFMQVVATGPSREPGRRRSIAAVDDQ
jgi:hypothetical protein